MNWIDYFRQFWKAFVLVFRHERGLDFTFRLYIGYKVEDWLCELGVELLRVGTTKICQDSDVTSMPLHSLTPWTWTLV